MATLSITEYASAAADLRRFSVPAGQEPGVTTQKVTYTTATQSAAFSGGTTFVRLYPSAACVVAFGANPTAVATSMPLSANTAEYFGVIAGQKVSVYDGTS